MAAPDPVVELVERFERNRDAYLSGAYNETQLRREFVDPFFEILGWDVFNKQGYAEAYKDVIHEDAIKVGGFTKAPDYCFRIGGTRKFFVEAKKPSVDIMRDIGPAFQLRRYAWSAKLPLSILSDFEEFAVYDCRVKPNKTDKASTARVLYLTYEQYAEKWNDLASIFARDAILKGSFDKYVETTKGKKGTAEVDTAFLKEIETWRDLLARNLAIRNSGLSQRELNYAVQTIIDRIIFLRICEDRGIEDYGRLMAVQNSSNIYGSLLELFERADERYNSGLFHFRDEKDRYEPPDLLTPALAIDDKQLKDIIKNLYYPDSAYEFSVLPADILGQVYEQFLGKVIRLTAGHRAVVEDKPAVKKAGGVFYTPTFIVDYIVDHTIGRLLDGKTPARVEKLRILDPACGSGSFLIAAYQYLLDWHRDWYSTNDPKKWAKGKTPRLYQGHGGEWKLTTGERKRILLNNIYGVDIDPQAVEVSKLSLLLKVLEGESDETLSAQLKLFHERALPDLGNNIKCGNSLISPDFYESQQVSLLDEERIDQINVFDWNHEFHDVMDKGGFDVAIGNPPYIPTEAMSEEEKTYFRLNHGVLQRKYDSSVVFILATLGRLNNNGLLSFISSQTWQTGENYIEFRKYLFSKFGIERIVNLPFDIFKNAYVDTGIYIINKKPVTEYKIYCFPKKDKRVALEGIEYLKVPTDSISAPDFKVTLEPLAISIFARSLNLPGFVELGSSTESTQGLSGSRFPEAAKTSVSCYPFLSKGQVYRYELLIEETYCTDMKEHERLKRFYDEREKLLVRRIVNRQDRLMATYTKQKLVFKKDINPFIFIDSNQNPLFVLGVLNSRLISYIYVHTSTIATKDDYRQTTLAELRKLPVPLYSDSDTRHGEIIRLVEQMISLKKRTKEASTPEYQTRVRRQIEATDRQIDQLVYALYGLTDEEVQIVEQEQ